jgi:hypothetical protein
METYELVGLLGRYSYQVCDPNLPWAASGGCYVFARKEGNHLHILRVGKCDSFKSRPMPPGHECWSDAIRSHRASHVLARQVLTEADRVAEEQDLIAAYNPPMNVQHRTGQTGLPALPLGLFGGGLINRSGKR